MSERWLSIVEYARSFSISDMTVRRRIKNGKLKAVLKDGKYYIPVVGEGAYENPALNKGLPPMARSTRRIEKSLAHYERGEFEATPEMNIIKNEGRYKKTFPENYSNKEISAPNIPPSQEHHYNYTTPSQITKPSEKRHLSLDNGSEFSDFCDKVLKKLTTCEQIIEQNITQKFQFKITALENDIKAKELELKSLRQQIEDLQLLVKVFEKNQAQ